MAAASQAPAAGVASNSIVLVVPSVGTHAVSTCTCMALFLLAMVLLAAFFGTGVFIVVRKKDHVLEQYYIRTY